MQVILLRFGSRLCPLPERERERERERKREKERERERDQLVCFVTRCHRYIQRGS